MTIATTMMIVRALELPSQPQNQMYSLTLLIEQPEGLVRHHLERTFITLHDIDHLLARVGFSVEEEKQTQEFLYAQLPSEEWAQIHTDLDPEDWEGQTGGDVLANLPEFYRRAYARYNIEAWLSLFDLDGHYLLQPTRTVSLYETELVLG
jgi:hypothetical protein